MSWLDETAAAVAREWDRQDGDNYQTCLMDRESLDKLIAAARWAEARVGYIEELSRDPVMHAVARVLADNCEAAEKHYRKVTGR